MSSNNSNLGSAALYVMVGALALVIGVIRLVRDLPYWLLHHSVRYPEKGDTMLSYVLKIAGIAGLLCGAMFWNVTPKIFSWPIIFSFGLVSFFLGLWVTVLDRKKTKKGGGYSV